MEKRFNASGALLLRARSHDTALGDAVDDSQRACAALILEVERAANALILAGRPGSPAQPDVLRSELLPSKGPEATALHAALDGLMVQSNALRDLHTKLIVREKQVQAAASRLDRRLATVEASPD